MIFALICATLLNPVVDKYADDLAFYIGYNDRTVQPAIGLAGQGRDFRQFHLDEKGLFGPALDIGVIGYRQHAEEWLADTTKSGTLVCWVKLNEGSLTYKNHYRNWECGGTFMEIMGPRGSRLMLSKCQDNGWGDGSAMLFYYGSDAGGKTHTYRASTRCTFKDWKVGEWRMIAGAWTADRFYVSVNGEPFRSQPYEIPLGAMRGDLYVRAAYWTKDAKPGLFSVDEAMSFSRKLTDAELKDIYETTRKAAGLDKAQD